MEKLARDLQKEGNNEKLAVLYNKLDKEIVEGAVAAAKKISRTDFGYMRNPELIRCGQTVLAYKYMLDCARRRAPATPGLKKLAKELDLDFEEEMKRTVNELRVERLEEKDEITGKQRRLLLSPEVPGWKARQC